MTLDIYKSVLAACPILLRPVIRILLRAGITFKQFSKISRDLFVDVATDDYGINGRKTNISRVAILTGISRSEVTKIRKKIDENGEIEVPTTVSNAGRLLSGWHVDPEFTDKNSNPMPLSIDGVEPNFTTLMAKYGGDIPLTAMLKELKKVSAIKVTDDNELLPLKRFFMPVNYDENRIFTLAENYADFGNTAYYNFIRDHDDEPRFAGRVFNNYVNKSALPDFKALVEEKGQALFEELDAWLNSNEVHTKQREELAPIRLGLGIYFLQDDDNKT